MPAPLTPRQAAHYVARELKADVILYNGPVEDAGLSEIIQTTAIERASDCLLIMTTYGGDANSAYRICRWLQRYYARLIFYPPSICASAGTLVALGAHSLIMSSLSQLGPPDVQLRKRNEIDDIKSGLVTATALEELREESFLLFEHLMLNIIRRSAGGIGFELASHVATQISCGVISKLYGQIDPEIIGQNRRDLKVAYEYRLRLARYGGNIDEEAIRRLVHDYPSHDFVIDKEEAGELFFRVLDPTRAVLDLTLVLGDRALRPRSRELDVERLAVYGADAEGEGADAEVSDSDSDADDPET